jgi:hypothetical protein
MLKGKYEIKLKKEMPYGQKIVKLSSEPVAFHLYKNRHFNHLKDLEN